MSITKSDAQNDTLEKVLCAHSLPDFSSYITCLLKWNYFCLQTLSHLAKCFLNIQRREMMLIFS